MKKNTQGALIAMAAAAAFAVLPTLASADTTTEATGTAAQQVQSKAKNSCKGKKASGAKAKNSCKGKKASGM